MGDRAQRRLSGERDTSGALQGGEPDVIVVGAGAAGLWCAEVLARAGRRVLVLEKTPRTGTKVLASGGTRCNVTTTLDVPDALRLFGMKGERFLRHGFHTLSPRDVRSRFEGWGVALEEAPLEKVFPASGNARDVRDALENAALGAGARIALEAPVIGVEPRGDAWAVRTAEGEAHVARRVVLAAGGMSYPGTGTTGDGYPWLEALGLEVVDPVPALVPLTSPAPWVHELTGLAWQGAEVTLEPAAGGKRLARRRRPVLFTHTGISGPGAMDVSAHVARGGAFRLRVDAFPDIEREALRAAFVDAARLPGNPRVQRALGEMETGPMPRRLFEAFAAQASVPPGVALGELSKSGRHGLVEALKGLEVPVDGTRGWDHAEVTAGGLALREVDPRSMAVNGRSGLFVIGELLDVDGPIGGLSFQAAFSTAEVAGRALAAQV